MLNILYTQQTNRTLPAVLDSCTFYFCLALSIYKLSYFLLFVSLLKLFSSVLYFFIHLNILFFSLCISLSFTIYHLFLPTGPSHPANAQHAQVVRKRSSLSSKVLARLIDLKVSPSIWWVLSRIPRGNRRCSKAPSLSSSFTFSSANASGSSANQKGHGVVPHI